MMRILLDKLAVLKKKRKHAPADLRGAAVLGEDDPGERIREPGGVGADQRARLVHMGPQLKCLRTAEQP